MSKPSSIPTSQFSGRPRCKGQSFFEIRPLNRSKLKEFIDKSYVLIRSEKYEQFLQRLGAKQEVYKSAVKIQTMLTLKKKGDVYALVTSFSDFPQQIVKFKDGEIIQRELHDGTIVKSLFEIKESTIKEVQEWKDKKVVIIRKFAQEYLMVSMEVDEVKCFRHYDNVSFKRSSRSETSKRKSTFKKEVESEVLLSPPVQSVIEAVFNSESEINACY